MTQIDFITSRKVNGLSFDEVKEFVLDRVANNRVLILERELAPMEELSLISEGMKVQSGGQYGVHLAKVCIRTESSGLLRKEREVLFNVIAPATTSISLEEDGTTVNISMDSGEVVSTEL